MLVSDLVEKMTYEEFLGWMNYFERRPIDWRDDDRCSKLLAAQGVKEKPTTLFPSLQAVYAPTTNTQGTNMSTFKGSKMFSMILAAKGGDKLNLD